ncbi:MAG TPA: hypothetical protein VMZ74_17605 [Ramlibacter sp.]|nr:hypothetical protein [Ramlibacter sp.]
MRQLLAATVMAIAAATASAAAGIDLTPSIARARDEIVARYGEAQRARVERGLAQVASLWRAEDGGGADFEAFARANFAADAATLDETFRRFEFVFESIDGHMLEIGRDLARQATLEVGPVLPLDATLAAYDPAAHITQDLFANKAAFVALLNFPLTTLDERIANGGKWTRRQWAEARLASRFGTRVPASVNLEIGRALGAAEQYIAHYNIWMGNVTGAGGERLFPQKLRLLSHWNLREEIRAQYANRDGGLARQRAIQAVMERIVTQTIPQAVVDKPGRDWNPFKPAPDAEREPDTRYAMLLGTFRASRLADEWTPAAPTLIRRRFDEDGEVPEARVRAMFEEVLASPLAARVGKLVREGVGRPLEPFDLWYAGFKPRGQSTEAELDAIVAKRYPDAQAYAADMPRMFRELGFSAERAAWLAENIVVDAARGSGHAMPAARREDKPHLRTRIELSGMNYKGYSIAVHEMGHNVEQVLSLKAIDHTLLRGVPNNAFTEAIAFVFQSRDLQLLGLDKPDAKSQALGMIDDFWSTYEIAGVSLVDMEVWHWMYAHPDATPAQLREATLAIAKDVWNRFYAPVFGVRDSHLLAIYSHMVGYTLYLPNYAMGHMITAQVEQQVEKAGAVGPEVERIVKQGDILPDLWMMKATGEPLGAKVLLERTERALAVLK